MMIIIIILIKKKQCLRNHILMYIGNNPKGKHFVCAGKHLLVKLRWLHGHTHTSVSEKGFH